MIYAEPHHVLYHHITPEQSLTDSHDLYTSPPTSTLASEGIHVQLSQ
jgi:hypothetical protein